MMLRKRAQENADTLAAAIATSNKLLFVSDSGVLVSTPASMKVKEANLLNSK